jgi:hypothetical protein
MACAAPRYLEKKKGNIAPALGESTTFAWLVPYEDSYSARLEKSLASGW